MEFLKIWLLTFIAFLVGIIIIFSGIQFSYYISYVYGEMWGAFIGIVLSLAAISAIFSCIVWSYEDG